VNLRSLLFLTVASLLLLPQAVSASTEAAEKNLKAAVNDVLAIAEKASDNKALATSLRPVLTKYLAFEAMTRRAVGPGWRQFTEDQRKQATQLFTTLIIRTYSSKFTPGEHPEIKYKAATTTAPGRVEIPTTLLYQGSRYEVVYRLEEAESWRITDVVIEGVSLIANYRSQFDSLFKKGGAPEVINSLKQSVATP